VSDYPRARYRTGWPGCDEAEMLHVDEAANVYASQLDRTVVVAVLHFAAAAVLADAKVHRRPDQGIAPAVAPQRLSKYKSVCARAYAPISTGDGSAVVDYRLGMLRSD
jgi:hypothetical protein